MISVIKMTVKKICIIGAGIGGLAAGAILSKKGHHVTIFEKESVFGGRATSVDMENLDYNSYLKILSNFNMNIAFSDPPLNEIFEKKLLEGYHLDLGYHVIGGGIIKKFKEILSFSKKDINILKSRLYQQKNDHYGFFVTNFEKIKMLPNVLRLFLASEKTMKKLDVIPMSETIKIYGKGKMGEVLEINSKLITTMNNLDLISSGEVLRTQKDMGLKGIRYPKKGLSYFTTKLSEVITKNNGKILLNHPVSKIIIQNNKAVGVVSNNKEYSFDIIISNILVQNLFDIVDEKIFSKSYVNNLKSLDGTASLCAYYSFKKLEQYLIGKTFMFIEKNAGVEGDHAAGMIDFMASSPEAELSPRGEYLVQSYIICTPEEAKDKNTLINLRKILDKNLEKIIPNFKSKLNWCFYPVIWHLDGVVKKIDNEKPEIRTSIKNLYLVGDCVKAPGIGFNCALNSARILCNDIMQE
jgi:protoporphyrinogen oxidase